MTASAKDGAAGVIASLVKAYAGTDMPVRLRLWDGSEAGPDDGPVLVARSPMALRRILWCPGELGLAEEQVRVWRLYLAGGALAFEEGRMGVDQILAVRSGSAEPGPAEPGPVRPGPVRPAP